MNKTKFYVLTVSPCPGCGHFDPSSDTVKISTSFEKAKEQLIETINNNYDDWCKWEESEIIHINEKRQKYLKLAEKAELVNGTYDLSNGDDIYHILELN